MKKSIFLSDVVRATEAVKKSTKAGRGGSETRPRPRCTNTIGRVSDPPLHFFTASLARQGRKCTGACPADESSAPHFFTASLAGIACFSAAKFLDVSRRYTASASLFLRLLSERMNARNTRKRRRTG